MIELNKIDFQYSDNGFRLTIPHLIFENGSRTAVVGPSGSGKTTLLRLISGIITPSTGEINIDRVNVSRMSDSERRNYRISNIGFVFQEFELIEYLNVYENILLPYYINRSMKLNDSINQRAIELSESMGLSDLLRKKTGLISQGEKQRVAICRALLINPGIILADEPTGNLDPRTKGKIIEILFDCSGSSRSTLIMVTHDHSLLKGFDRVIDFNDLLSAGKS